jgi:ribonucleotide reductase alpha subunit
MQVGFWRGLRRVLIPWWLLPAHLIGLAFREVEVHHLDAEALAAASPMVVATELPAAERATLFFIVVAEPSQPFFGTEATGFEHLLAAEGYPYVALDAKVPHGWTQVRQEFPAALEAWAADLVAVGVFQA